MALAILTSTESGADSLIDINNNFAHLDTSSLSTGILKNTTSTGALTIAVAADFPTLNQNTTGNAATVTTNANLTGVITSTGNATAIASQTGTGSTFVVQTQPTLIAPLPETVAQSAASGTVTFNLATGNVQNFTFSGTTGSDAVTLALSNPTTNQVFLISITQNSGGSGTVTWFSTIRWAGGTAPTLTTTASKRDTFGFICTGSGTYDGFVVRQNI